MIHIPDIVKHNWAVLKINEKLEAEGDAPLSGALIRTLTIRNFAHISLSENQLERHTHYAYLDENGVPTVGIKTENYETPALIQFKQQYPNHRPSLGNVVLYGDYEVSVWTITFAQFTDLYNLFFEYDPSIFFYETAEYGQVLVFDIDAH